MPSHLATLYSLQTWTLRHNLSPRRGAHVSKAYVEAAEKNRLVLECIRRYGYRGIEVSARGHMPLKHFLDLARESSLFCSGLHLPCLCAVSLDEARSIVDSSASSMIQAYPERHDWTECVLTFMGNPEYLQADPVKYRALARVFQAAMRSSVASGNKFAFAYHLYDFDLAAGTDCIRAVLDSGCKLVLDTFYFRRFFTQARMPSAEAWKRLIGDYQDDVIAIHINDTNSKAQQTSLGKGCELWVNLFAYFGQLPNTVSLVVEHDAADDNGPSMAQESAVYLLNEPRLLDTYWKNRTVGKPG